MTFIKVNANSIVIGHTEWPNYSIVIETPDNTRVGIRSASNPNYVIVEATNFAEYVNNTSGPFASQAALITALQSSFDALT